MTRVVSEPAYILHSRPYRETSRLLEIFTSSHGRLALIARGSRGARSRTGALLQPFRPLLLNWSGRGELPLLQGVDSAETPAPVLHGNALLSALYVNELLMHLLHRHDVHEEVFSLYHDLLYRLPQAGQLDSCLREFELRLLDHLGFGLNLRYDADSGEPVEPGSHYAYFVEHGPVKCASGQGSAQPVVSGSSLLDLSEGRHGTAACRADAKKLLRYVLQHYLGARKLRSRELFRRVQPGA